MDFSLYNPNDVTEIKNLFVRTFSDSESEAEGEIVGSLAYDVMATTEQNDMFVFIAKKDGEIAGSIIFSRLTFENGINAFLLSPVAVSTAFQGQGVGQALINFGLNTLKEHGVALVFTYGDPNFYSRVGFAPVSKEVVKAPLPLSHPEGWLGQSLTGSVIEPIQGESHCVAAMNKPEIW